MNIILLGAPGSGKGTQAAKISKKYNIPHISTGDIFRYNIKNETPIGLIAKSYIDKGQLCPDDITVKIVEDRINKKDCKNGFLLDGFPRTINQAIELDKVTKIDVAVNLNIELSKLMRRLIGRRNCPQCGGNFHIDFIGNVENCPVCNGKLYTREDDNEATVAQRLDVYAKQTATLMDYYSTQGKLLDIDGDGKIDDVYESIIKALEKL